MTTVLIMEKDVILHAMVTSLAGIAQEGMRIPHLIVNLYAETAM